MASKKWALSSNATAPVGYETTTYTTAGSWSAAEAEDVTAYGSSGDHAYLEAFDDFDPQLAVNGSSTDWRITGSDGWTTDSDNYVVVRAADGEGHGGTIGGGFAVTATNNGFRFVYIDFLLQDIEADGIVATGEFANTGKNQVDRCIVVGDKLVYRTLIVTNCLCIDNASSGGIDMRSGFTGVKAINCTSDGHSSYGVYGDNESAGHFFNCVVTNSRGTSDPFYNEGSGSDYNATDYSSTTGSNSITSIVDTDNYNNLAANDYSIKDTSADIYDAGNDLSATYPELAFDIAGNPRSSTYSIGAYEYVSGGGTTVTVPQANLTFSTTAPTVDVPAVGIDITPNHADLALSTEAPDVTRTDNRDLTVNHADLALSTEAPDVTQTANVALEVGAADLALTTEAPTAEATDNRAITVGHADLALTSEAPDVLATEAGTILVPQADLTLSSEAPSVEQTTNAAFTPAHADLTFSTTAPQVFAGQNIGISPDAASLLLSTVAPSLVVADNQAITIGGANLALSTAAPTVNQTTNASMSPAAADLTLGGFAPSVDYSGSIIWTPITEATTTWTAITEASTTWTEI